MRHLRPRNVSIHVKFWWDYISEKVDLKKKKTYMTLNELKGPNSIYKNVSS